MEFSIFRRVVILYLVYWFNYLVDRVFANGPGDLRSIPGRDIPKTFKMVIETSAI